MTTDPRAQRQHSPEIYEEYESEYWELGRYAASPYRRLLLAVIELTIRDATRPTCSGQKNYRQACQRQQELARAFFFECSDKPKGWGWYITTLGLEEWQVHDIERAAGVRIDAKTEEVHRRVSQRPKRYAGSH